MENQKTSRRNFLNKSTKIIGGAVAAGGLASCSKEKTENASVGDAFNINSNQKFEWRCVTTWPPNFPVLGEAVVNMAKDLEVMSSGRLKIKVYGGGELVPAMECFDAVTQGAVQMAHGAAYYWAGKLPSAVFFATIPFGMTAQQINAWLLHGGGMELWQELYHKFDLEPFPSGNTGVQMGGWFNKEINSIEDIKGLKMRIPGMGGDVFAKAGGAPISIAGGELYTNLERGVIDATEWIGPYHDYLMGFHKIAKYYYYPGWHEPGSNLELMVNKKAYDGLPPDLQEMIKAVSLKYNLWVLTEFEAKNNFYMQKILAESDVELRKFPDEVLKNLKKFADERVAEITASDPFAQRVYESFSKFKKDIIQWGETSDQAIMPYL
ncbi:TRAP transporter substrate-binding protein [Flexithrix dorotheae]|uniref:TRAP transporter substrate-binding protein n=1 Tax=Flexithrix dorotheae TaxID=70993 RepID=UPI00035F55A9|nr:TRAP transporter substrate-binding protein [Flexithrix dorotheae]